MDTCPMDDSAVFGPFLRRGDDRLWPQGVATDGSAARWLEPPADNPVPIALTPIPAAPTPLNAAPARCGDLIGNSPSMHAVFKQLRRVARSELTVLLEGESGTGKELGARAIHTLSGRRGAFVAVNCGALAAELLASVLFGHERGSFTGAVSEHRGLFEQAEHGTLFLDEVTEMPYALQAHLLRALESGAIRRIGGNRERAVDCRIVAATNRDSRGAVRDGLLREDLFYRLTDYPLRLPPLRERPEDIFPLARYFLDQLNCRHATARHFAPGTEVALMAYAWPGNVRELKQVVERTCLLADEDRLHVELPAAEPLDRPDAHGGVCFRVGMSFEQVEQKMLRETLRYFANDKSRAAAALGISLKTIYNRLARSEAAGLAIDGVDGVTSA